jgi:hypothetical protein
VAFLANGDHTYEGARADHEQWRAAIGSGSHLLFHDALDHGRFGNCAAGVARLVAEIALDRDFERVSRLDRSLRTPHRDRVDRGRVELEQRAPVCLQSPAGVDAIVVESGAPRLPPSKSRGAFRQTIARAGNRITTRLFLSFLRWPADSLEYGQMPRMTFLRLRLRRFRQLRFLPALAAVAAIVVWSALSVVNAFGTVSGGTSASSAYQYQYSVNVTGSGTIDNSIKGQVSFSLSAKVDETGTTGSCSVNEPATKTKIKCLGVTSIFPTVDNGCTLADITGPATINGTPTTYEIQAEDCGSPGTGHDSFAIVADGFERGGVLTSGNITVHGLQ